MQTKYNTGEYVLIPAKIISAREENNSITYQVDVDTYNVPEEYIKPDTENIGAGYGALLEALDEEYRRRIW